MTAVTQQFDSLRYMYETEWSSYAKRLEAKVKFMHTLKQGMELALLTCAFLAYYLISCLAEAISMI